MGGIAPGELAAVRGRLETFADEVFESLPRKDQRARGACYLRGLMLEGRRKSVAASRSSGPRHQNRSSPSHALNHFANATLGDQAWSLADSVKRVAGAWQWATSRQVV